MLIPMLPAPTVIFAVEDDPDLGRLIQMHLESAGFTVRLFAHLSGVLDAAERTAPALFLLDIMVPGGSGLELCRQIRSSRKLAATPVIFLTAKTGEADKLAGFDLGADDYISKPFSPREMVARVRAVLRRFEQPLATDALTAGEITIDPAGCTLTVRGTPVVMTATEFRLLEYLARHPGRVFSRAQLLDAVWRDSQFVTERSVDVYIRKLREKIEAMPETPVYIATVRGMGYRFDLPVLQEEG